MKKLLYLFIALLISGAGFVSPNQVEAYNFGDFRSETLTAKAWEALAEDDIEAVLAYTNKVMELYGAQAQQMQESIDEFVSGPKEDVYALWALNDVSTSLFIQGEAFRKANMVDEAKEVYKKLLNEYTYGQSWDDNGWFWKPAEAAKEKLAMLESGTNLDFGDYSSAYLTDQAWKALGSQDLEGVVIYTDKVMELYANQAQEMQNSLTEYAWESKEKIFSLWALNDVGTALFIRGEAFRQAGKNKESAQAYKALVDSYYYAQCWDPGVNNKGWFWKPAEAAQQALDEIGEV